MSSELVLSKPSMSLKNEIWQYRQEFLDFGETNVNGSSGLAHYDSFDEWLEFVLAIEKDRLSRQNVHASTFFTINKTENKIVGSIQLRHFLTPELEQYGGHIGYGIRPTERGKGYGKQQLKLLLNIARHMKMSRVMISCYKDNEPSRRTAISCGGVLTSECIHDGVVNQIYWIDIM